MLFDTSFLVSLGLLSGLTYAIPLPAATLEENLLKRLHTYPVPSVEVLKKHIRDPLPDTCVFYTGGTFEAASLYAAQAGKNILPDLDIDGWASPPYADACPLSMKFQQDLMSTGGVGWTEKDEYQYWDNMSQAFAEECVGDAFLVVNQARQLPASSHFVHTELPTIAANGKIKRLFWASCMNMPPYAEVSGMQLAWDRCGADGGGALVAV
ncbi:hypothetical protein GTA08_BOTSDO12650 [Botryosphaeria dothidea]|uniref:Uncharacterized protein n=1 Tax=Botryosphaeria dothidea TaxID=55169 RepID=A0A8H4J2A5_9PEZI|nr:hypothetical protein GTA08_BOTSDO14012 [Botryosphaeria dothidea]KAF4311760.1 hypothetical protein GTA08_BOTSDO12650 [Botryosphaeria dothidea]